MAITARNDFDRLSNGLAGGNVVSGVNTLSGNTGKDTAGVAPNKVTQIQLGANPPVNVAGAGADIDGAHGTLHINPDGSYTYTRLQVELINVPAGATDVFLYTYADKNGVNSTATLSIEVLPETVAVPDSKGLHKGTTYDDLIDGSSYTKLTADGMVTIDGGAGQDKIFGAGFLNSHLFGGAGNDYLIGNDGDDVLEGGAGADRLDGTTEDDTASYASSKAAVRVDLSDDAKNAGGDAAGDILDNIENLTGSAFNDTLTGDGNENFLQGGKGNDTLSGGASDDELSGGAGIDSLFGGDDFDQLPGGAGADKLDGGNGFDTARYLSATSKVTINLANTALSTGDAKGDTYTSIETFVGSIFNDTLIGNDDNNDLIGHLGNDSIDGGKGLDTLSGNQGNDTIHGGQGDDEISGGSDSDTLFGDDGKDEIYGDFENDVVYGGADDDKLHGDDGDDTLEGGAGDDDIEGGSGNDTVNGGAGSDELYGDADNDKLLGGAGDDDLEGGTGNDTLDGGNDNDIVAGNEGNDTVAGGKGDDYLFGLEGNDTLTGGDGKDYIWGGEGSDKLTGGKGIDTFVFGFNEFEAKDTVTDFKFGEDTLQFLDIVNGAGNDLQDLLDAGINAVSSGTTLSIFTGDQLAVAINGWTGPQITSMQDLSLALGSSLEVIPS